MQSDLQHLILAKDANATVEFMKNIFLGGFPEENDDAALKLAHETLVYCKSDQLDPASYVTAASAAYNVIYHIGRHHERYSIADAKTSLAEFDHCIKRHKEILALAVEEGRITSEIRYREMAERIRYLTKLREAQGKYMKRVMATKMTSNKIKTTK